MKIIAENPAEEALLWRIKALSDELVNQDNRSTNMPVWTILDNNKAGKDYGAVMYFTGKAAEQHINENAHHYEKPMTCVRSAHDNLEKAYLNEKDIAIDSLGNIFIIEGYDHNDSELWYARILPDPDNKRHIIEQYPWLKDKNGREIYQGDICSFTSKTGKHTGVVERLDNLAGFGLRMVKNNFRYTFSELDTMGIDLDTLEVVGNIHEDSELVEEK